MNSESIDAYLQRDPLGLRQKENPPGFTRFGARDPGIQHTVRALLERQRDPQISPHLQSTASGGDQKLPGGQERTASAGTSSEGRTSKKSTTASTAVQFRQRVGTEGHRSGIHQLDDRRDQTLGYR